MPRRYALLAVALAAAAIPTSAQRQAEPPRADYVPDGIWRDQDHARFLERWFGDQLHAMREPALSPPAGLHPYRRRFRLLVLPNYAPAYAIRVDETAAGGRVRVVGLDGAGGYAPGRIARQRSSALSRTEMRSLNDLVNASGLPGMADGRPPPVEPRPDPETGETRLVICLHATYYVFELLDGAGRRFVVRDACDMPEELGTLVEDLRETFWR